MKETLSDVIKQAKTAKNVSARQLCEAAGLSESSLNKFLAGETRSPNVYAVGGMCALLGVSLDEYFGIQVPNTHELEMESLRAHAESNSKIEAMYINAIAKKDKFIRRLVIGIIILAIVSVGGYEAWDLTHADFGFLYRG